MQEDMETRLRDDLERRARETFGEIEGGLLTRWLTVAETVGPEGKRGVWVLRSADMLSYEYLGLLDHARTLGRAALVLDDEDDE